MIRNSGRRFRTRSAERAIGLAFVLLGACGFDPGPAPMRYDLAPSTIEATKSAAKVREQIESALAAQFGTPADPRYGSDAAWKDLDLNHPERAAPGGSGEIDAQHRESLRAANRTAFAHALSDIGSGDVAGAASYVKRRAPDLHRDLAAGTDEQKARTLVEDWYPSLREAAELYRQECLSCHGVEGGGDGPMSWSLKPRPRDFRNGIFKYTALEMQSRPRREDLLRTLEQGVPGTSMPNFQRLSSTEREGLVDYVRLLSIRGEVERALVARWKEEDELTADSPSEELAIVWDRWKRAPEKLVAFDGAIPPSTPERIARGEALFHDPLKGNCASCHGASGLGDGAAAYKVDVHGKREPAYVDAWGQPIAPRNLRDGLFRGGSRPIDVYRRIFAGIPGGPMPAMGHTLDAHGARVLSDDDLWCLVHYVRHLAHLSEAP
jgi:mono/diheme cytochrome c family protein